MADEQILVQNIMTERGVGYIDYNGIVNKPKVDSELSLTSTNAVQNMAIAKKINEIIADTVHVYTHSKSGTVHNFVGTGVNGIAKITAPFDKGDTFQVNGVTVSAYCGASIPDDSMIVENRWVSFIFDGTQLNFKGGGGVSSGKFEEATAGPSDVLEGESFFAGDDTLKIGTMPKNVSTETTLKPGEEYSIPKGYHDGAGVVKVGSLEEITAGDATEEDIVYGKTAWVNGQELIGNMPDNSGMGEYMLTIKNPLVQPTYTIPKGYHDGTGVVRGQSVWDMTEANATENDIVQGYDAWVHGIHTIGALVERGKTDGLTAAKSLYVDTSGVDGARLRIPTGAYRTAVSSSGYPELQIPSSYLMSESRHSFSDESYFTFETAGKVCLGNMIAYNSNSGSISSGLSSVGLVATSTLTSTSSSFRRSLVSGAAYGLIVFATGEVSSGTATAPNIDTTDPSGSFTQLYFKYDSLSSNYKNQARIWMHFFIMNSSGTMAIKPTQMGSGVSVIYVILLKLS